MKLVLNKTRLLLGMLQKFASIEMPLPAAWNILKVIRTLEKVNDYIEKERVELVIKYGQPDTENGNEEAYLIPDENVGDFNREINELLDSEVEVDIQPIDTASLGDIKVTVRELLLLEDLLK